MKTQKRIISILLALVLFLSCTSQAAIAETGDLSDSSSTFQTDPTSGDTKPTATDSPPAEPSQTNAATTDPSPTDPQPTETVSQTEEQQPEEGQRSPSESSPDSTTSITTFVSETPVSETTPETTEPVQSGTEETTLQPDVTESEPTESETTETDPPEEKTFAVTLDSQGGTTFEPLVINEGEPIGQLPVPVKDGFGFDGWSLAIEGKLIDSSFIVNEDITLFAVWDWILVPNNPDGLSGPESVSAFIDYNIYPETSFGTANLKRSSVSIMSLEPGDVVLNKTATPVEGMVNTWDVLLEIEAKDTVTTSDIVLVIDRSGSMRGSKLTNAKNAAREFVDVLLPSTSTRIAVVSFAGEVTTNQVLTNNATNLKSAIDGLYASGGTFTQAAMRQAAAILAGSTATYKNIVLLSDGEPTYSYGINDPYKMNTDNLEPYSVLFGTAWQTTINTPQAQFNTTRVGSGSSMWQRYDDPNGTSNDKYYNNGHAAVAEAGFFKDETNLKYLYTIALDAGTNGTPILDQMASPGKSYTATESELLAIFAAIAGEINAAVKNASIADPMGMGFEVIGDVTDVETNSGTVNLTGTGIDWQAGTPPLNAGSTDERYAYLSYRIEINDDILDVPVPADGLYETNGPTVVTYTNSAGSTISENFPIPKVDPILLIVEKVLKNDKGEIITTDDRIFDIHVTSNLGYNQTYSLKAGEKKVMTNLRLEDIYTVSETGVSGTPASALADYDTTVNVYDIDQTTFNIDQGSPDSPVLVTNQEKSLGKLTVKKVFNNMPAAGAPTSRMMSLAAEPLVFSFTVTGPEGFEETFDLGSGGERTFEGLKYGTYTVVETTTGYDTTYDPAGGEVTLSIGQKEGTVTVTNRVQSGIDITATKIWDGGPLPYPEVWFRLFRTVDGETFESAGVEDKKIPIESPFTVTWQNLPQYSPEGISYVYSVQESVLGGTNFVPGTPAGYYKTEDGLTVTNKWVTGSFTPAVTKALSGRDLVDGVFTFEIKLGDEIIGTATNNAEGKIVFENIEYTQEDIGQTYTYTIIEIPGEEGGMDYDPMVVEITVTVTDAGNGELSVIPVYSEDTEFNNSYEASGSWTPTVTKALSGRDLQAGEFSFEIYAVTGYDDEGEPILSEEPIGTAANDADGNVVFENIDYTQDDIGKTFTYAIVEIAGTEGGMDYDAMIVLITVTVEDAGHGELTVTPVYPEDVEFNNTYEADGDWTPIVSKALSAGGRELEAGEFTFNLLDSEGDILQTKTNAADGSVTFDPIHYTQADIGQTYTYTIVEVAGDEDGMTYDPMVVEITVTVTDAGNGELSVTPVYPEDTEFNNTYEAVGDWTPEVSKALSAGGRDLEAGEFTFELRDAEGTVLQTKTNAADGSVTFDPIQYSQADIGQTYTYTIIEIPGEEGGMDYDPMVVEITVTVTDAGNGELSVTPVYPEDTEFNNSYEASGSWTPTVTKALSGRDLQAGEFSFEIYAVTGYDDEGEPILSEEPIGTATNDADGNVVFENIDYTQDDIGKTFTYAIVEIAGTEGGMDYDAMIVLITVTVEDAGHGELTVTPVYPEDVEFNNTYEADGDWTPIVSKALSAGGRELEAGEFTFNLLDSEGDILQTKTNAADGSVTFDPIHYTQADIGQTYTYTIVEVAGDEDGMTYDPMVVEITVTVTDAGNGELSVTPVYPEDTEFNNTYEAVGDWTPEVSKALSAGGRDLEAGEFTFELRDAEGTVLQTKTNAADGSVTFDPIQYSQADIGQTYTYTIIEIPGEEGGMDYDPMVVEITVTVTDAGNGELSVTPVYPEDTEFNNSYEASGSWTPTVTKALSGRDLQAGEFSFEIYAVTGYDDEGEPILSEEPIGTATNDADGNVVFENIDYTQDDIGKTFTYAIVEIAGTEGGMDYDAMIVLITVTVEDAGHGELTVTPVYPEDVEFNNTYEADGDWTPIVSKALSAGGRELEAGEFTFNLLDSEGDILQTKTNAADGSVTFDPIHYTQADIGQTYTYTIVEVAGDEDGMTYDPMVVEITVTVTDAGNGELSVTPVYPEDTEFNNTYEAVGDWTPEVSKALSAGGRDLEAGEFTFELRDAEGTVLQTKTNAADGSVTFDPIQYSQADIGQTYTYTIIEIPGEEGGMDYDPMVVEITVTVTDAGNGELSVTPVYPEDTEFNNSYEASGSWTPTVTKALSGRDLQAGEFSFEIYAVTGYDDEGEPILSEEPIGTAANDADGNVVFENIDYTQDDIGKTFTYAIVEIAGTEGGMDYDAMIVLITVTVEDAGHGELTVTPVYPEDVEFNNTYEADGDWTPIVSKALSAGGRELEAGEFTFNLLDSEGDILQTKTNAADGSVTFDPIHYTQADIGQTYTYTIVEVAGDEDGMTYDPMVVEITVTVTDAGNGALTITPTYSQDVEFNNTYEASGEWTPKVTKALDAGGRLLADDEFEFELKQGDTVLQTKKNLADGSVTFDAITYTEADIGAEFTYTITEVAGSETGMTYDPLVIEISVTVADAGNGELTVTPTYPEDIVFKNLYEVSGAWTPEVTKILTGRELVEGEFEFELVDAADVVLQTVTNLADGTVPFLPLVFDQEDIGQTFEFTIREKSGANIDYTYDTSIYRLIVTVANAEGGGLEITTATYKDDETEITPDITFTNIYTEPTPVTHDPPVEKLVIGNGAPQDAQFSFQMKAVTPDAPMPEGAVDGLMTHTITGAGSFEFGVMEFTEVGTYVYELRELETENKNFAFDPTIYTITITITQEGHNLVKDVIYTKNNSTEASTEAIVFTNTWQTIQIKGTKTWIGGPAVKPVIWFKLQRSLPGGMPEDVPGAPILKLDNVTEVTWTDLAKFAEGGETYIFSVREVDQTGQILNLADYTKTENGLNVTNTAKSVLPKTGEAAPLPFTGLMLLLGAGLITILRRKRSKI